MTPEPEPNRTVASLTMMQELAMRLKNATGIEYHARQLLNRDPERDGTELQYMLKVGNAGNG